MPLTKAQRRKINAQNAQSSTGPHDTSRTRFNALKHGLRAEVLFLPDEDPAAIQQRSDAWNDYYQPQDPAEQHLVNECVRATLLSDRIDRFHTAEVSKQIRHARPDWIAEQVDRRETYLAMLTDDPAAAVIGLRRFGLGVQYLIDCWERLEQSLDEQGYWDELERDEAIRLLSGRPEPETLKQNPDAWVTRLFNLVCRPRASDDAFTWLFHRDRLPEAYRDQYSADFVPDAETCRQSLRETVATELAALRARQTTLGAEVEDSDLAEAEDRAVILRDETTARLFLRYHAESRTSFHRAYSALVRTIDARAEAPTPVVDLPPLPNLADRVEQQAMPPNATPHGDAIDEPVSAPLEAPSPNEAKPAGQPIPTLCETLVSVDPEAWKPKARNGREIEDGPKTDEIQALRKYLAEQGLAAEQLEMVPIAVVGAGS